MEKETHHVGITVESLEKTVPFYEEVLGFPELDRFTVSGEAFETVVDTHGASGEFVHLDANGIRLELVEYDPAGTPITGMLPQPGTTHIGIEVPDLMETYSGLPDTTETISEPQTTASGTTLCFLRDPEGNLIELLETA